MAVLPQQLQAERVDGEDVRLVDEQQLPAGMGVPRVVLHLPAQGSADLNAHLLGGGVGKGDHQELIDIRPLLQDAVNQPLHQHRRLARPAAADTSTTGLRCFMANS